MDDEALNLVFPKYVCRRSFFLAPRASLPRRRSYVHEKRAPLKTSAWEATPALALVRFLRSHARRCF